MVRLTTRIINWLKSIFKKGGGMSFKFPEVLVKEVEKEIKLEEKAQADGRNKIPGPEQVVFSLTEEEAITKYDEKRQNVIGSVVEYLNPIKNKIIGLNAKLGNIHFYIAEFKNRVEQTINTAEGKLTNLKDSFDNLNINSLLLTSLCSTCFNSNNLRIY